MIRQVASASGRVVTLQWDNVGTHSAWFLLLLTNRAGHAGNVESYRGQ
jgi:hypothetical protein